MLDLSVVIPTLNAAATLGPTLAAIGPVAEVVVVDGGSTDATAAVAGAAGARVIAAPRGRGAQLAAGVAAARRDWVLLLHADTRVSAGWQAAAAVFMACGTDRAGWFRFALDSADPRARRLERMVAWRCRVLALPYGDQGLLVHQTLLERVGGIRPLPLMEDVDLIQRLGRRRLQALDAAAITSAMKWELSGWYRRSMRNLVCLGLWHFGVPPQTIVRLYG